MHPDISPGVPSVMDCVTHVVGLPRVCGLVGDSLPTITVPVSNSKHAASLVDSGANICVTGLIETLVDVIPIPALPISVAVHGSEVSLDDCCTHRGLLPLTMEDGSVYYQLCYFCKNIVETIISPQAIVAGSDIFVTWQQTGHKDGSSGRLRFYSDNGLAGMTLTLEKRDGLYYAPIDVYTVDHNPVRPVTPRVHRIVNPSPPSLRRPKQTYVHVTKSNQTISELWMLRLGSPGEHQLDLLPGNATGIPSVFEYHPFRFLDFKEQARVRKQAAQRSAECITEAKKRFYMDFGFMRSSRSDYSRPDKHSDRVIASWDGFSSYLLIVDEASQYIWVFLTKSKTSPLDIIDKFLRKFGHANGGSICTDQGGELAGLSVLLDMVLRNHSYVFKPTGADSPSQNGQAEIYNDKLAVRTRTLLYGAGLPAKYWSSALLHAVYLHNRLVHSVTRHTPFEGFFGVKPDLAALRVFGSRVCVKRTGHRRSKLDRHDFTGIFLGYTATVNNITYIDLDSGLVKTSHHAQFDEAWYLQDSRPPAAQLLYDLGLEADDDSPQDAQSGTAQYPPIVSKDAPQDAWKVPPRCRHLHLPLRCTPLPHHTAAKAARVSNIPSSHPTICHRASAVASAIAEEYHIGRDAMDMIYMSPDPYHASFDELLDLRRFDHTRHPTAGLSFFEQDGRVILAHMQPGTPGAKIPRWRTRIRGAWLLKIGTHIIHSISDVRAAFSAIQAFGSTHISLLFAHPEIRPDISCRGLPIMSTPPLFTQQVHDQLNNRWEFSTVSTHLRRPLSYQIVDDGGVLNTVTRIMKLTRGKLIKQPAGMSGLLPNIFNLINMMPRVCLALPLRLTLMLRCFEQFGRMLSKLLTAVTRLGAHVMDHHAPVKLAFLMRHMLTVWTKWEAGSFILFQLLRIF